MPFEVTPFIPVVGTIAAALVAGGIARANLIASKESKISEFRQAWIDALRDDLAALFSNTRTLARAVQESRALASYETEKFGIEKTKITEVRHGAAETYHRICLRLNRNQPNHEKLSSLLKIMMGTQQSYLLNIKSNVAEPLNALEKAASYAEEVLKAEWETVKFGESAYREAVQATRNTLVASFAVLVLFMIGIPMYYYWSASPEANRSVIHAVAAANSVLAPSQRLPENSGRLDRNTR